MHFLQTLSLAAAALATLASAHGHIQSPARRNPGNAFRTACGNTAYSILSSDPYGPSQNVAQASRNDPTYNPALCDFNLCKGLVFADNSQVHRYSPGQVVPVRYEIRAPHPGVANLSVVDTTTKRMIGTPLKTFSSFATTNGNQAELNWSFTMPNLGGQCNVAGRCVLQFWWDSRLADQTYTSCLDFVQEGSGPAPTSTAPGSSTPTTTTIGTWGCTPLPR